MCTTLCGRFGMSRWRRPEALERWAESHPTHIAIFGAAMRDLPTLGPAARLRLYHEVSVARADEASSSTSTAARAPACSAFAEDPL
jgi:Haem-containing dehydratase